MWGQADEAFAAVPYLRRVHALADGHEIDLYPDRPAAPWKNGQASHPAWLPGRTHGVVPCDDAGDLLYSGPG